jgi:hypothetical protein
VDVIFEIAGQQGVRVVRNPLLEGGGVVECLMCDGGRGDEDGAEGGGGGVFDLEIGG